MKILKIDRFYLNYAMLIRFLELKVNNKSLVMSHKNYILFFLKLDFVVTQTEIELSSKN